MKEEGGKRVRPNVFNLASRLSDKEREKLERIVGAIDTITPYSTASENGYVVTLTGGDLLHYAAPASRPDAPRVVAQQIGGLRYAQKREWSVAFYVAGDEIRDVEIRHPAPRTHHASQEDLGLYYFDGANWHAF